MGAFTSFHDFIFQMEACCSCSEKWGVVVAMLLVNGAFVVMSILVKKSLDQGMNTLVLITLRQAMAAAFIAPISYLKERKSRQKLTWWVAAQIFLSALFGVTLTQYLSFLGLQYTNATIASAFSNMTPVFTFLIALPLRQERLCLKTAAGKAKLLATIFCIGGALALIFYRGPPIGGSRHAPLLTHARANNHKATARWVIGSLALLSGSLFWSAWFLVQPVIQKQYPTVYSSTTMTMFMASLQAATIALAVKHNGIAHVWASSINGRLHIATIVYAGVVGSGIAYLVMSGCIAKTGPVFTAAFTPLIQVDVAIMEFALTKQAPLVGSVLGSVLVVLGLYLFLWGKSKEETIMVVDVNSGEPAQQPGLESAETI